MNGKQVFNITDYNGNILWKSDEDEIDVEVSKTVEYKPSIVLSEEFRLEMKPYFFIWLCSYFVKDEENFSLKMIDTACRNPKYNIYVL